MAEDEIERLLREIDATNGSAPAPTPATRPASEVARTDDAKPGGREQARTDTGEAAGRDFFAQLATHWKRNYAGWTAWVLTPDLKLPTRMRLKESRRVPMWNGPIECRLFRFDMVAGSNRKPQH